MTVSSPPDRVAAAPRQGRASALLENVLLLAGVCAALGVAAEFLVRWLAPAAVVGPAFTEYDPVYGKRLKAGFTARRTTPEFSTMLRTNSLGFRDPEPAGPLTGSIVFLGDSYTLGYGVEDDEAFPALVRVRLAAEGLDSVPVVNAGLGNSGNGWWLPFLERRAPGMEPGVVVLQIAENDFGDNRAEDMYELEDGGQLRPRPIPPPGWERRVQGVIEAVPGLSYSHLVGTLRVLAAGRGTTGAAEGDPGEADRDERAGHPLTRALLAAAIERCQASGWPVMGVLIGMEGPRRDAVVEVFDAWGVPWVRVPSKEEAPDLYFELDAHLNVEGHRLAAERVWGTLEMVLARTAAQRSAP